MALILDTNALSAVADNEPAIAAILGKLYLLALPVIVLGEYRVGIAQSRHRKEYELWLERFVSDCSVLDINLETSLHYAAITLELKAIGKPIPANDVWIAALCRQHSLPLLTRDHHFDVVPNLSRTKW